VAVENEVHARAEPEVPTSELGELVMEHLRRLDQVAFVRFASVYRQFQDVQDFVDELDEIMARPPSPAGPGKAP
jgi:transcriptional repressor NrdR